MIADGTSIALGAGSHGLAKRVISGWQWTTFFNDALRGYPANLPSNAVMLKDASKLGAFGVGGFRNRLRGCKFLETIMISGRLEIWQSYA